MKRIFPVVLMCSAGLTLTACFDDEESISEKYKEWRGQNLEYLKAAEDSVSEDGKPYFEKLVPAWAPNTYVLVHWHNDRALTANNLSPMDNSTTKITYELFDINGKRLADSFSAVDSVYTSKPLDNIIGMWAALTSMNVGDSVSMVIPYEAGYGEFTHGTVQPYSVLRYNVKLKEISAYEVP